MNSYGLNQKNEILRDIHAIGFNLIEISCEQSNPLAFAPERRTNYPLMPSTPFHIIHIGKEMESHSLRCASMNASCELCHPKSVELLGHRIDMANFLKIPIVITGIGRGWQEEERKEGVVDNLRIVCNYAKRFNIVVCLKTDGWLVKGSNEVKQIIDKVGCENFKIDFDPANIIYYNDKIDVYKYLSDIVNETGFVHLRGSSLKKGDKIFSAIGSTGINYKDIFNILESKNFNGGLCLDLENAYLWEPDSKHIPLTHAYWQNQKLFNKKGLEKCSQKIRESIDYLKTITNIKV
jgi:sugar phosphate isomerase/epimerase